MNNLFQALDRLDGSLIMRYLCFVLVVSLLDSVIGFCDCARLGGAVSTSLFCALFVFCISGLLVSAVLAVLAISNLD